MCSSDLRVAEEAGHVNWTLCFQSRSGRPEDPWLAPDIGEVIASLSPARSLDCLVIPVGFLVDHMEVLYDLDTEWVVDAKSRQFSKNPWSPFDGRRVRAGVVRTMVRGETVYADGEIVAEPGSGVFLSRSDDHSLRSRPEPAASGEAVV